MTNLDLSTLDTFMLDTPVGKIKLLADKANLYKIEFTDITEEPPTGYPKVINFAVMYLQASKTTNFLLKQAIKEIAAYFDQGARSFGISMNYEYTGTPLQQATWEILRTIPYGVTVTINDVVNALKTDKSEEVQEAIDLNPLPFIIPSHRVVAGMIGLAPELGGYSGGRWRKEWLLNHERVAGGKQKRDII